MVSRVYQLTGNVTIGAVTPTAAGQRLEFIFIQDATGGRSVTWDATMAQAPQPNQAPNAVSVIEFVSPTGTAWVYDGPLYAPPWETLIQAKASIAAATVAGTYVLKTDGTVVTAATAAMAAGSAFFPLDSAQYPIGGKLVQVRLVASVLNNATAPAATFTFHLYSISSLAGLVPTLAAASGEQTAVVTTPAANAQVAAYGAAYTMPAATGQGFALGVVTSATIATGAAPELTCLLQSRVV